MKAAPRLLPRLLRDLFRLEPLEPRILLSADPVLGMAAAVLPTPREEAAALFDAYAPRADMVVATTPGQVVLVTNGPAQHAQADWLVVDVSQLNGGNGTLVIGGPDSDAKIFIGEVGGPAVTLKDLILLNPAEGGHVTHQAPLVLTGQLLAVGSGHTQDIVADDTGAVFSYNDNVVVHGDRILTVTGTGIQFGSAATGSSYSVTGDGNATNDTLTLRVNGDVTFFNTVGGSDPLEKLAIEALTPNQNDLPNSVTFNSAVTLDGNLEIRADPTATIIFKGLVTLNKGGDLIISGGGTVKFEAGLQMNDTYQGFAGDASITADEIDFGGANESIKGAGILTLRPLTPGNAIDLGSIGGSSTSTTLNLDTLELGKLADGFSKIVIGYVTSEHAVAGSGAVRIGAGVASPLVRDNLEVYGGTITVEDPAEVTNQLIVYGSVKLDAIGDIELRAALSAYGSAGQTNSRSAVNLYSLAGAVRQVDSLDDNNAASEPLRASTLTVRAARGITLPFTEITDLSATNVTTGDISITETAAGGDVNVVLLSQAANASGLSLRTTSGAINVNGSVLHAGTGLIDLAAGGATKAITVGSTIGSAGGAIKLTASGAVTTTAAIITNAAAALEVNAGTTYQQGAIVASRGGEVKITAATALQMLAGTTVRSLDAGGTQGIVRLKANTGNVTVANVQAGSKMFVDAGAAILALAGSNPNLDGESAAVLLAAASGIGTGGGPLQTRVGSLAARNTGSGSISTGIFVREATSLVLTSDEAGVAYGLEAGGMGGSISVVTLDGALTVAKSVTSTGTVGNILLQSGELAANEGTTTADLTVAANVGTSNGGISLAAADSITIQDAAAGGPAVTASSFVDVRADDAISMEGAARLAVTNGGTVWVAANAGALDLGIVDAGATGKAFLSAATTITDAQSDDAGTRVVNVTAGEAWLRAGTAIGAAGALLDTSVGTIAVQTTAPGTGVFLSETDALAIGQLGATDSSRVGADGGTGTAAGATTITGLESLGALVLHTGGNLSVTQRVQAAGNLHVDAGGTINVSAAVYSSAEHVSVVGAGQVDVASTGRIEAASPGRTLDLASTGGSVVMADGARVQTEQGNLSISAAQSVTLGRVDARSAAARFTASRSDQGMWGDVSIVAGGGITGNAAASTADIFARQLRLQGASIGSDAVNVQTEASLLSAMASGAIFLTEDSGLDLGTTAAITTYRVDPAAATGAATEQTATALAGVTSTGSSIVLRTTAGRLSGDATGTVTAGGNLLLASGGAGSDIDLDGTIRSTGGHISLDAGRDLLLDGNVLADGAGKTIDLLAAEAITLAQLKKVATAGGSISLDAGGTVTIEEIDAGTGGVRVKGLAVVDGDAAGDTEIDIKAGNLVLQATTGIGAVGATLETQVDTLSAIATGGGVYLREADDVSTGSVTVNVQRVAGNGISGATVFGAQEDLRGTAVFLTSAAGNILVQGGTLGTPGVVATGPVRLEAAGLLGVYAAVDAGTGSLSLLGASVAVGGGANANVAASGGTVDVEATVGGITMAADASALTQGGAIRARAAGTVQLGVLDARTAGDRSGGTLTGQNAWGAVSVVSTSGSILDAAGPVAAIYASNLRLEAGNGIGATTGNLAIQTEASVLSATAGAGGVFVEDRSALTIGETAAISVARPDANGTVPGTPGAAGDALQAGIGSGGAVAVLAAGALDTTRGVQAAGNLVLKSAGGALTTGALVRSSGGNLALYAGANVALNGDVATQSSGKTIVVDALGAVTQAQNTTLATVDGNIAVDARGGTLTVESMSAGTAILHANATSILDGDVTEDGAPDLVGAQVQLTATGAIGASGNALETDAGRMAVRSTGGAVFVTEANSVTLGATTGVLVQELDALGAATGATRAGVTSLGGTDVVLRTTAGSLSVDSGQTITATGNLLLQVVGAANSLAISANAVVTSDGSMSLVAGDQVSVLGSVSVNGAGTLDIRAARADLAQNSNVTTAGGDVSLVVTGTATIERIDAGSGGVYVKAFRIEDGDGTAGETEVDIVAARVALDATQYVGIAGNAFDVDAGTLSVHAGTNAFLTEANGVLLGTAAVTVNQVGTTGEATPQAAVTQSNSNANGGAFVLRALAGSLQTTATGTVTATGNILLETLGAGAGLTLGGAVQSTTASGSISVRATGALQLDANVDTVGGTIELKGATGLAQAQGTTVTTGGGHASLDGGTGTVTLERVTAGIGRVRVAGAAIVDGDDATDDPDITANSVLFTVGSGGVGTAANAIDITATTMSALATGGGSVFVAEADALELGTASFTVQNITAAGTAAASAITGSQSGVTGTDVVVRALGGNLEVKSGNAVEAAGNLLLESAGGASVLTVGAQVRSTGGALSLVSSGGLTVNADVRNTFADAAGTIDLRAGGAFTQLQGTTVATAGANLALVAGGTATVTRLDAGAGDLRVAAASIVDGDASGSDDVDLVGDEIQLKGTNGIGASGASLDTSARVLAAQATSGSIFLSEADALHVGSVAVDVRNVATGGSAAVQATADTALGGVAGQTVVLRTTNGLLAIDEAVAASGNLLLAARGTGSDLTVGAAVTAAGAMSLAAQRDVTIAATVSTTGGGANTIDIVATSGAVLAQQGSDITTANANVLLQAQGDITIERVSAGTGAVRLDGAAIIDGDTGSAENEVDVIAAQLQIAATGAIGAAANPLETTVTTLSASAAGGIFVSESDALTIDATSHSVNRVASTGVATATTATTQSDVTSTGEGDIVLVAAGDIDLPADADVRTGGAATLRITSTTGQVLMHATDPGQSVLQTGSGEIRVQAEGDIRPGAVITTGQAYLDSANGVVRIEGNLQRNGEDIDLRGDDLAITVPVESVGGVLTIGPLTAGTPIYVGGPAPAGGLHLDTTEIGLLQDGFDHIVIGSTLANQAVNIVGTGTPVVFLDPVELVATGAGGSIAVSGTLQAETLTVRDSGGVTTFTGANVVSLGALRVEDELRIAGAVTVSAGAAGMRFTNTVSDTGGATDTLALDGHGGPIVFEQAVSGLQGLSIDDAGEVTFSEAVTVDGDLEIHATGTITFTKALTLTGGGQLVVTGGGTVVFAQGADLGSGDATLEVDDVRATGGVGSITGTGTVTVSGAAASTAIRLGSGAGSGGLEIDAATLAAFGNGFTAIRFGSGTGATAGTITVGSADLRATDSRIDLRGSSITVNAAGNGLQVDTDLRLRTDGAVTMAAGASITSAGAEIDVAAGGAVSVSTLDARSTNGGSAGTVRLSSATATITDAKADNAIDVYAQALDFNAAVLGGNVIEVAAPIVHVTPPAGGLLLRESGEGVSYFNVLSGNTLSQAVVAFGTAVRVTSDSSDYTSDAGLLANMGLGIPLAPTVPTAMASFSNSAALAGFGTQVSSYLAAGGSQMAAPELTLSQRLLDDASLSFASGQPSDVGSGVDWWLESMEL